jgi:hypothetical protein
MADRPAEGEAAGVAVAGSKGKRSKANKKTKQSEREQTADIIQTADIPQTADPEHCTVDQDAIAGQQQQQQTAQSQATEDGVVENNTDTQGTHERAETAGQQQSTQTTQEEREVDWEFWGRAVSDLEEIERSDQPRLAAEIKQGIPDSIRGQVWQLLARYSLTP